MNSLFNDEIIIKSQQRFRSVHNSVYTEEVNKVALSSNNDKKIQTFDKVTSFPYGTNVFKVFESEMLSKNKFSDRDKDKDKDKTSTEDKDNTTPKTKTTTEDKNKIIPKTKTKIKTEDKDHTTPKTKTKTEDKDDDIDKSRNKFIQVFQCSKRWRDKKDYNWKNDNWKIRQIVWVFWDDDRISELCEKWVDHDGNYAYTRFEELRTRSGEVLFTRECKATASKDKSDTYIDIDELQMFKDFSIKDKMVMMNCFRGMIDRRKAFSLISSRDHCQRSSPSRISDMPRAGFEPC